MSAFARIRSPSGDTMDLMSGDLIGRSPLASYRLEDPMVSEAHALVSLRGGELKLLALRGRFGVDGVPVSELALQEGQRVFLARSLYFDVVSVELPDRVLALVGTGVPSQLLTRACSYVLDPEPRIVRGIREDAVAQFWSTTDVWRWRDASGVDRLVEEGTLVESEGLVLRAIWRSLGSGGLAPTARRGQLGEPVNVVLLYDVVEFHAGERNLGSISGLGARLISELALVGAPLRWQEVARLLWRVESVGHRDRHRLDVTLGRLRQRLAGLGVRSNLVSNDGKGLLRLVLEPGDSVEDRT